MFLAYMLVQPAHIPKHDLGFTKAIAYLSILGCSSFYALQLQINAGQPTKCNAFETAFLMLSACLNTIIKLTAWVVTK